MVFTMKVLRLVRYMEEEDPSIVDVEGTIVTAEGKYKPEAEVTVVESITPETDPTLTITLIPDESGSNVVKFEKSNIGHRLFEEGEGNCNVSIVQGRGGIPQPTPSTSTNKKRRKRPIE